MSTEAGATDVALVRISDGSARMLTDTPGKRESDLMWSDTMERLVYIRAPGADSDSDSLGSASIAARLMFLNPRGGGTEGASGRPSESQRQPSISADGREIVYLSESPSPFNPSGLKILRLMSSSDEAVAARGTVSSPRFSLDRSAVALLVSEKLRGSEVWHIVRGSQGDAVVSEAQFDHDRPRYSRGGDSIYFERVAYVAPRVPAARAAGLGAKTLAGGDVCRVHLATRDVQCLGESDAAHEYSVEPSPSRDEVAFVRQASGRSELVLVRGLGDWGLGEGARAIVQLPDAEVTSLEWSPDGERLAFTIGSEADATITVVDRRGRVALEIAGHGPVWAPPGP